MSAIAAARELTSQLYDTKTRPALVAKGLLRLGAQKYLNAKQIELFASLTTVQALLEKKDELQVIATPYLEKARHADGRAEILSIANEKIAEVVVPYAQPYVTSAKEKIIKPTVDLAATYVAKVVGSPTYQKAMASLLHVREHPREAAAELKSKAIDLIKYDNIVAYREYVQSPAFQSDTVTLLKIAPTLTRDAARRGLELIQTKTSSLNDELAAKRAALQEAWKKGYELGRAIELDDLRMRANAIVAEIKAKLLASAEAFKGSDFDPRKVILLLTKLFGLDKFFNGSTVPTAAGE